MGMTCPDMIVLTAASFEDSEGDLLLCPVQVLDFSLLEVVDNGAVHLPDPEQLEDVGLSLYERKPLMALRCRCPHTLRRPAGASSRPKINLPGASRLLRSRAAFIHERHRSRTWHVAE